MTDLLSQINQISDPKNLTDIEKKHTPVITTPDFIKPEQPITVIIEVGRLASHPNEINHFIGFIELYQNDVFIARVDMSPSRINPKVIFEIIPKYPGMLKVIAGCNIHGVWQATKDLTL